MTKYDDPKISDQMLLDRCWELRLRDSLSRTPDEAKARMAAAGSAPSTWAPLTVDEHLELLQKQRWLERRLARREAAVHRARLAGASWVEIADALGLDVEVVRARFRVWVAGQQQLHGSIGIGLDDKQAAAARELLGNTTVLS